VHARVARAFCWPAGSLAWASYRAGPLGLAQEIRAELDPAQKIKKKQRKIWAESQAQLAQSLLFYSLLF